MGNQSQDEVFLAAQEAVGAHRDSQGRISKRFNRHSRTIVQQNIVRRFKCRILPTSLLREVMQGLGNIFKSNQLGFVVKWY